MRLWFTYHHYYKRPDWLGPRVSAALGIPYIVAEASHAAKRCRAERGRSVTTRSVGAIRVADAVMGLTRPTRGGIVALLREQ